MSSAEHNTVGPSNLVDGVYSRAPVILTILALVGLVSLLLLVPSSSSAEEVTWGETTIMGTEAHENLTITLDGHLLVAEGGFLTLTNSTILVNASTEDQYSIVVAQGGQLELRNVDIRSNSTGSYSFTVSGNLEYREGRVEDLNKRDGTNDTQTGLRIMGTGDAFLSEVDIDHPDGLAMVVDGGSAVVLGGTFRGSLRTILVAGGGYLKVSNAIVTAVATDELVTVADGGSLEAVGVSLRTHMHPDTASVAVHVDGSSSSALLDGCTVSLPELAWVEGGSLEVVGGGFSDVTGRAGIPDLNATGADVTIEGFELEDLDVVGGTLWLIDVPYTSGDVTGGTLMSTVGSVPPLGTIDLDVRLEHYYWVDFQLLNRTKAPTPGLDLRLINSGGKTVMETVSGAEGWVRDVPVRSWVLEGTLFEYEPSHRVEFGGADFQITNLQVYDNATVVLWNSDSSRDLALDTDAVTTSDPAPRENRTFDLVVDGPTLVPFVYPTGTAHLDLYIDENFLQRATFSLSSRADARFRNLDLDEGRHSVRIVADPSAEVEEMNEGGNNVLVLVLEVAPEGGGGDRVDLYVSISRTVDSQGNEGEELVPGIIYVDYTARAANSRVWLRDVLVRLLVDGRVEAEDRVDMLTVQDDEYVYTGRFAINLPRGDYDLAVVIDPDNEIEEQLELNNEDTTKLTLEPEGGNDFGLDPACCSAILIVSLLAIVTLLGFYAQRKQRQAEEEEARDTIRMPPSTGYPRRGGGPSDYKIPRSIDQTWTAERMEKELSSSYSVDGATAGGVERVLVSRPPAGIPDRRYKFTDKRCPRCGGADIMGFEDGSAKCQSCKKIFYPGRRYS